MLQPTERPSQGQSTLFHVAMNLTSIPNLKLVYYFLKVNALITQKQQDLKYKQSHCTIQSTGNIKNEADDYHKVLLITHV